MIVQVVREDWADPTVALPQYATAGAAGADLRANFEDRADVVLQPGARVLVPTGLRVAVPEGFEMQIRPRSGLALKNGVTLANAPGTIDADYRGEVKVPLINLGQESFTVEPDMRIAQMVIAPVMHCQIATVSELGDTDRGSGGRAERTGGGETGEPEPACRRFTPASRSTGLREARLRYASAGADGSVSPALRRGSTGKRGRNGRPSEG